MVELGGQNLPHITVQFAQYPALYESSNFVISNLKHLFNCICGRPVGGRDLYYI